MAAARPFMQASSTNRRQFPRRPTQRLTQLHAPGRLHRRGRQPLRAMTWCSSTGVSWIRYRDQQGQDHGDLQDTAHRHRGGGGLRSRRGPGLIDHPAHGQTTGDMQIQARDGVTTALDMEVGVPGAHEQQLEPQERAEWRKGRSSLRFFVAQLQQPNQRAWHPHRCSVLALFNHELQHPDMVGLVTTQDGQSIEAGEIAGPVIDDANRTDRAHIFVARRVAL